MRLFAAAVPPPDVLDHLAGALVPLIRQDHRSVLPQENWHLTLAFYGELPNSQAELLGAEIAQVAAQHSAPVVHLSGSGWFAGSAAWIGLGGQVGQVVNLMADLETIYPGVRDAPKARRPHLTIGRRSRRTRGTDQALDDLVTALSVYRGPEWKVDQVVLMQSELGQGRSGRPKYSLLASARLGWRQ